MSRVKSVVHIVTRISFINSLFAVYSRTSVEKAKRHRSPLNWATRARQRQVEDVMVAKEELTEAEQQKSPQCDRQIVTRILFSQLKTSCRHIKQKRALNSYKNRKQNDLLCSPAPHPTSSALLSQPVSQLPASQHSSPPCFS